ncbi:MAG TPA: TetR/AcrR family transcriptional regulator [Acidimicrobiales bacterium]|nr:TetR/AcrR family transcriptional regulator [Acidimicrobiales bacterium]
MAQRGVRIAVARRPRAARGEGERLRGEILRAAERLLIDKGAADAVSIRGVATAVGVTPPSIYLHFADKDELIFAVCQQQFERLEELVDEASVGIDDPLERLRKMGEAYVRFGVGHPEQYRILLMSKGDVSIDDFTKGSMPGVTTFRKLMAAIEACMDAGIFRRQDVFLVATGIWSLVHGITSMRITLPEFPFAGEQRLLDHVFETYARGLAP